MSKFIPGELRQLVEDRANGCCEYCQQPQFSSFIRFHIEHIISLKHGGSSEPSNLALSCSVCNYNKGSDLGTYVNNQLIRFFNPRTDHWKEHFELIDGVIESKTDIGTATAIILQFNTPERIILRKELEE